MAELSDLRVALAKNLSVIPDIQVSAYMLANPTPPAIHVVPGPAEYHVAMNRGAEWWEFTVQAYVALVQDMGAQMRLDKMLASSGPFSVVEAIESDTTLDGNCDDLIVTRRSGYTIYVPDGRGQVLGAEWNVRVLV